MPSHQVDAEHEETHGGNSQQFLKRASRVIPGGVLARSPLPESVRYTPVSAKGAWFSDTSGTMHLDYLAGAGALILGHGHERVCNAIAEQVREGSIFFGMTSSVLVELAEAVVRAVPYAEKTIFTTTGSEATAYALRLARAFTGREKVLKFEGAYHGNHEYSLISVSPSIHKNHPNGTPDTAGTPKAVSDSVLVAPYNDLAAVRHLMAEHWRDIAAIIVEPVQREIFPIPGFLEELRVIADENGCLLIFDEVITGFRLAYGGAQEYFGVTPHLSCFGKILGGGLPLGAVVGEGAILDLTQPYTDRACYVMVNGTHHGAPLAAAAGLATLAELRQPGFYQGLNAWGDTLRRELQSIVRARRVDAQVVGEASIWHLSFTGRVPQSYADTLGPGLTKSKAFDLALVQADIHVLPGGRRLTTAAHGDAELEATLRAVDKVCRSFF